MHLRIEGVPQTTGRESAPAEDDPTSLTEVNSHAELPVGEAVEDVDSGEAVAARVAVIGQELKLSPKSREPHFSPEITGYCSGESFELSTLGLNLGSAGILRLRRLP